MTITLITGAGRGIGHETARQLVALGHDVWIGARDAGRGQTAAQELGARFVPLDVTDDASVAAALATIDQAQGRLDVLVHNAGVQEFGPFDGPSALRTFDVNAVGIVRVTEAALPLLRRSQNPNVVTVSSAAGSFGVTTDPGFPLRIPVYGASKAAATMLTVQYAKFEKGIKFNAVEPGFTATDMTAGFEGGRPARESAAVVVGLATLGVDGPTGTFTDENGTLPW
ncbi:SDR family NAD(P)-dependent oxidoreductase [Kineosporia succinea]|uniref:NAD(P)-dependent dehydrogenase (Short-subunit alcohol dehydrogenase family) n=1 Tax=Kineosporia succinea TaxID=84632 RepID=A0ABT9PCR3_9ACTN|nr:SDR family NAD(P)-dependent oxidoreductase [Kineosporia succinea]MDP9830496.1 NAD(P)-dependent dehydrogenase (short-subunit alcohol dehydrogenase family) [Kineosporia succinea]